MKKTTDAILSINAKELHVEIQNNQALILVDVRELYEHDAFNIGGLHIPFGSVFENISRIPRDQPVVFYCQKGIRSNIIIQRLQKKFNYNNLINLSGGMENWRKLYDK